MKNYKLFLEYYLYILSLELIFRIFGIGSVSLNMLYIFIYLIPVSLFLVLVNKLFYKVSKGFNKIILFIIGFYFALELVFKKSLDIYFSIKSSGMAGNLTSFLGDTFRLIVDNWYYIILMFIPFVIVCIFVKNIKVEKLNIKKTILYLILILNGFSIYQLSVMLNNDMKSLYYEVDNSSLYKEYVGVVPTTLLDIKRMIFDFDGKVVKVFNEVNVEKEEVYEKNWLDVDFDSLIENETNNKIKSMHEYFKNESGTSKNKYTDMFEGKNLILFMAESFNSVAVSEELTPTLYKLTNSGFVFDNFYSPVIFSTIGGEFQELTGLYPSIDLLSKVWRNGNNTYNWGIGNVFKDKGYNVNAYHNNQYNFQNRNKYLKSIGFDNYMGCGNGLEKRIDCKVWPQSDIEMIDSTVNDYVNSTEPFFTYYVTVSGHMAYNWGNNISKKNRYLVNDLDYSNEAKAYIATQIELDRALESLINKLDEKGVLDNTVIALVGDHYPYDLDMNIINEMSNYERDNLFEVNRSNFILWNNKIDTVKIDKVASQLDVVPTLYNLFGIDYDSRFITGKDILSDSYGLAIFNNQSWISDKGRYNSISKKFISDSDLVDDDYVLNMNNIVKNRVSMSKMLLKYNYYDIVKEKSNSD